MYRLDPILTTDGLLRVGGRIRRAEMPLDVKHPCILPKRSHVTELIICHFHQKVAHQGRGMTHNSIRSSGFWIIGGSLVVSSHISKCVRCRKLVACDKIKEWRTCQRIVWSLLHPLHTVQWIILGLGWSRKDRKMLRDMGSYLPVWYLVLCIWKLQLVWIQVLS